MTPEELKAKVNQLREEAGLFLPAYEQLTLDVQKLRDVQKLVVDAASASLLTSEEFARVSGDLPSVKDIMVERVKDIMEAPRPRAKKAAIPKAPKPKVLTTHADYLREAIRTPEVLIDDAKIALAEVDYDTMVGRGLSGAIVIPWLARALGKHWMIVRKEGDGSHSTEKVEGSLGQRWLFVDDLVSSGKTMRTCCDQLRLLCHERGFNSEFVGAWTYQSKALIGTDGYTSAILLNGAMSKLYDGESPR